MAINYLAEVNAQTAFKPDIATPADRFLIPPDQWTGRECNVYCIGLFRPKEETYWSRPAADGGFGGWYDTPDTTRVEIYVGQWLERTNNFADLKTTPNLFYTDAEAGLLYFNVPKHPWLYEAWELELAVTERFLHSAKDVNNPSDSYILGDYTRTILALPSDDRKLSDPIHGSELFLTFSIQIDNSSGDFDLLNTDLYFNGPARLYKTWKNNPTYADFKTIRTGVVENVTVTDRTLTFTCAEKFRSLEQSVCGTITKEEFDITTDNAEGKPLPIVFGEQEVALIKLSESGDNATFAAAEYISEFVEDGVYDSDGNPLPYTYAELVITAPKNASYAKIVGYTEKRLGYIITQLISDKAGIPYNNSFWDTAETDGYRNYSPLLNIAIKSGTVRAAVNEVLKSDSAFLIQKNNALFTLRKWGADYGAVTVFDSYLLTKHPTKTWADAQKNFFSDCVVKYDKNDRTGDFRGLVLNNARKTAVEGKYNKLKTAEFETHLVQRADAVNLAARLSNRFNYLKETISIAVGKDTGELNLLDKIKIMTGENDYVSVNGRIYSQNKRWIIKAINPAQDTMTLEEWTDGDTDTKP